MTGRRRWIFAAILAVFCSGCSALDDDGIPWPDPADILDRGPCDSDLDCPDTQICHGTSMSPDACHIPCLWDRDCPDGWFCGELVGELQGIRVCFDWGTP